MSDWDLHCRVLGLGPEASPKEIRQAYRRLALRLHPDQHGGSVEAKEDFQRLHESYQYLMNHRRPAPTPAPRPTAVPHAPAPAAPRPIPRRYAPWLPGVGVAILLVMLSLSGERERRREPAAEPAPPARGVWAAEPVKPEATCDISLRSASDDAAAGAYRELSEPACQKLCQNYAHEANGAAVKCAWAGKEFLRQAARKPVARAAPAPATETPVTTPAVPNDGVFRSTCFMTVVQPGEPRAAQIANDTAHACKERCRSEVLAHPYDRVVECTFAGQTLLRYIPDPIESYIKNSSNQ